MSEEPRQSIQLRGSATLLPMAQRVAEQYMAEHPGVAVSVSGGGSYRGYKAILDDTAGISNPLTSLNSTQLQAIFSGRVRNWRELGLAGVTVGIKPLVIDGIAAGRETILDGSYPARGELALVTGPQPSPLARAFVQYFVDARKGMEFIDLIHAIPAR